MNQYDRNRPAGEPFRGTGRPSSAGRPDMFTSLADAVRENPVAASLIGIGAMWMFMGGNSMTLLGGRGRTSIIGAAAHGAESVASGATHMASGAAHGVARAGNAVASGVSSAASGLAENVSHGASRVGDYVSGAVHGVDAGAQYHNTGYLNQRRGSSMPSMRRTIADVFDRHPLALGLAGLAVGMGVAASLPVSETERETLGKARDAVGDKVSEVAEQAKEFGGAVVQEIRQQGLGTDPRAARPNIRPAG